MYLHSANTHLLWVMINARLLPDTYRTGPDTFTLCICIDLGVTRLGLWRLCVPQLTQASFLQKKSNVGKCFLISVTLR